MKTSIGNIETIKIIPIRRSEAWLLIDEKALRKAAGKPSGKVKINLPPTKKIESLANPKEILKAALEEATEFTGRKKAIFDFYEARQLVGQYTEDFSALRQLSAFQRLETDIDLLIQRINNVDWQINISTYSCQIFLKTKLVLFWIGTTYNYEKNQQ